MHDLVIDNAQVVDGLCRSLAELRIADVVVDGERVARSDGGE